MAGAFCISIDLEGAWGVWDKPSARYHQRCAALERHIVDGLLALFGRHDVRATWAIVGRLLERDPARAPAEIWYAPPLIEAIQRAAPHHDIGSHSYAHPYFGETAREALRADLAAARRVHDAAGLPFTSFVFPRNQVAHVDLLRDAGVKVFRSVDQGWHTRIRARQRLLGRAANLIDKAVPIAPDVVEPCVRANGLVELPSSMLLLGRAGVRRAVPARLLALKATRGLDAAARTGKLFHLWFHPSNFYDQCDAQLALLGDVLAHAAALRRRGVLEVRTMADYAEPHA